MPEMQTTVPEFTTVDELVLPTRRVAPMIPRANVTSQLENLRDDWGYWLRLLRNSTFVVVSAVILFCNAPEKPNVPLRVWICGYWLLCAVHVVMVLLEYYRWNRRMKIAEHLPTSGYNWRYVLTEDNPDRGISLGISTLFRVLIYGYSRKFVVHVMLVSLEYRSRSRRISVSKSLSDRNDSTTVLFSTLVRPSRRWEKLNNIISGILWLTGSIWMVFGSKSLGLLHVAPRLFWLTLAFLAIDVLFAAIRFLLAIFLGFAVCFSFPCIFGFMYFIRYQKGASDADISILPKYRFEVSTDGKAGKMVPMETNGPDFSVERDLVTDDSDCCICLCSYEDKEQLNLLPCNHHFHSPCIQKWLKVKGTCPLCDYGIHHPVILK